MNNNDGMQDLLGFVAKITGRSDDDPRSEIATRRERDARRASRHNQRYDEALARITGAQRAVIERLVREGATQQSRIRQDRASRNVCVFLHKQLWDARKARMGTKLWAVYPDGSIVSTFEKSISVKASF